MKSPLIMLRGFTLHRQGAKEKREHHHPPAKLDELDQAAQDIQDLRSCYDSLLSAAAATANSAYEFSEALQEMGTCLLEKTALNDDEDSDRVLLMLGKAQLGLQKLVNSYRAHIIETITSPSESLLKELQTVEEMKRQSDEKRDIYKSMLVAHQEKRRSRHAKGEMYSTQQLLAARDDYVEEAALFAFRLKSLKQGQSRSLLTQAARHHAAQLNLFRKGLKSLELVEPHVKEVAEQQHIDYQFHGLEDDETDNNDDDYSGYESSDDGELSFDYGQSDQYQDVAFRNKISVEENVDRKQDDFFTFSMRPVIGSQSAPLLADKRFDSSDKMIETQPLSARKFHSYVLPTPHEDKNSDSMGPTNKFSADQLESKGGWPAQLWHSSSLVANKLVKDPIDNELSSPTRVPKAKSVLKESNVNSGPICMPSPTVGLSWMKNNQHAASDTEKFKRLAYSGPLLGKARPSKPMFSTTDYRFSMDYSLAFSAKPEHAATKQPMVSSTASTGTSPRPWSSPKISELHELPRPPTSLASPTRPTSLIGHSGPLVSRYQVLVAASRMSSTASPMAASPLPAPPLPAPSVPIARSFSIPSNGHRKLILPVTKLVEAPSNPDVIEEVASPPLTPISLTNIHPASTASGSDTRAMKT